MFKKIQSKINSKRAKSEPEKFITYIFDEKNVLPSKLRKIREIKMKTFTKIDEAAETLAVMEIMTLERINYFIEVNNIIRSIPIPAQDDEEEVRLFREIREQYGWRIERAISWYSVLYKARYFCHKPFPKLDMEDIFWHISFQRLILESIGIDLDYWEDYYQIILTKENFKYTGDFFNSITEIIEKKYGNIVYEYITQIGEKNTTNSIKITWISFLMTLFFDNRIIIEKELWLELIEE
jgi:hypothetical protein